MAQVGYNSMTRLHALIAILITLSLVVVPASIGASAAGMASIAASAVSDCGVPCSMADQADSMAGMPMSSGCNGMGGQSAPMTPSACAAFCTGFVALPVAYIVLVREASGKLPSPDVQALLTGRADPPEPYPPRS
jgi:hypothetical protein